MSINNNKISINQEPPTKSIAADSFSIKNIAFSMGFASGAAAFVGNPLEVVKVSSIRECLAGIKKTGTQVVSTIGSSGNPGGQMVQEANPLTLVFTLAKKQGLRSLYKGSQFGGICLFMKAGTAMGIYETWRRTMGDKLGDAVTPVTGALLGRFAGTLITFPLENAATMLQDSKLPKATAGSLTNVKSLSPALFTGLSSMIGYELTLSMFFWLSFHNTSLFLRGNVIPERYDNLTTFLSGAVGSFFGGLFAHPFDLARVIKVIEPEMQKVKSTFGVLKGITKTYGPKALTIGLGARLVRLQLANSINMTVYINTREFLRAQDF